MKNKNNSCNNRTINCPQRIFISFGKKWNKGS